MVVGNGGRSGFGNLKAKHIVSVEVDPGVKVDISAGRVYNAVDRDRNVLIGPCHQRRRVGHAIFVIHSKDVVAISIFGVLRGAFRVKLRAQAQVITQDGMEWFPQPQWSIAEIGFYNRGDLDFKYDVGVIATIGFGHVKTILDVGWCV
ncbi:MAG: hypothetical protein JPMHGGIA_00018 [Saprospiraceae bacterium]|nr:hypothetical protein [Saprospiraceae bacterium]